MKSKMARWLSKRDDPTSLPKMGSSFVRGLWVIVIGIFTQFQKYCGHQLIYATVYIADWEVLFVPPSCNKFSTLYTRNPCSSTRCFQSFVEESQLW